MAQSSNSVCCPAGGLGYSWRLRTLSPMVQSSNSACCPAGGVGYNWRIRTSSQWSRVPIPPAVLKEVWATTGGFGLRHEGPEFELPCYHAGDVD
ncbi:hypothetical protein BgiBS90_005255 [Biomphalaria glabrata]|nr:hypothetical protein BgiBS90_005255 [Biomphalaria glabrata]